MTVGLFCFQNQLQDFTSTHQKNTRQNNPTKQETTRIFYDGNSDGPFIPIGRSGKAKDHGKAKKLLGTPPRPLTGPLTSYNTKIRVILVKKHPGQELHIGAATKAMITSMMKLDNGLIVESCTNNNLSFSNIDQYPKVQESFKKYNGQVSHTIFFNIKSNTQHVLNKMKTDRNFMQLLRDNGLFTFEHPFEGQSLERIGFFSELYHKTMHMNDFQKKVQHELTKAIANHQEYHLVPPFAINANITRHREEYNGQSIYHNTEAFEVECAPSDAAALVQILCLANLPLRQFGTFIPFSIIREDPELLIQKIADNNHLKTIMTTIYLNGWHTSVMHDNIEENTTTQQALINQTELGIASIERTYNTDIAGQWAVIVPITEQNNVRNYVNNVLIPATTVLKSYETAKSTNSNYNNGLSITRFKNALANSDSLRNKTKFLTTADNLPYQRSVPPTRNRNTQPVTVNFDSSPQRNTQTSTTAWTNTNESTSVVSLNSVTTNPYMTQRSGGASSNSTINTNTSDKTTVSQLFDHCNNLDKRIGILHEEL